MGRKEILFLLGASIVAAIWLWQGPAIWLVAGAVLLLGVAGVGTAQDGKYAGLTVELTGLGKVPLSGLLAKNSETEVYRTHHPGVVVKFFDLECGKPDEYSYGPYMEYGLELANFDDIQKLDDIRDYLPAYYGANINAERKFAYIAMEYIGGQDLTSWCADGASWGYPEEWVDDFREAVFETLSIMRRFHQHGIILIDFKPDDILRLADKRIKFVDLGAFYTPRQFRERQNYVYSTTPDHAELVIDASNVPSGVPLTEASDIFSAGVALFEMATGKTRLAIDGHTADDILSTPEIFLFRNSQIRDMWRSSPQLKGVLPLLDEQLKERRVIFSEIWHLLKGYVGHRMDNWDTLSVEQKDGIVLETGTTFIREQLPEPLQWLAGPIAQATTLRSIRLKSVAELMKLMARPLPEEVLQDLAKHDFIQYLRDLERPVDFVEGLNTWEARLDPETHHWAMTMPAAFGSATDTAGFAFLKRHHADEFGHRFYHMVSDLEADPVEDSKLTVWHLRSDHYAWLGSTPG